MSEEFKKAMEEGWARAREAKDQRRAENRAKWAQRRDWSTNTEHRADIEIPITPVPDEAQSTGAMAQLRAILADTQAHTHERIKSARILLDYEVTSGAASRIDYNMIDSPAYQFLRLTADDPKTPRPLKFQCLESLLPIENLKKPKADPDQQRQIHEFRVELVNAERRTAYAEVGLRWSAANRLLTTDDFEWPEPELPALVPFARILELPEAEQAARAAATRAQLRSVRARNRPDNWEPGHM
jgi:hypothetical protein